MCVSSIVSSEESKFSPKSICQNFRDAEDAELQQLHYLDTWSIVPRSTFKDEDAILKATWVYRIKRLPTGTFRKFKARFCARGDLQKEGVNFSDTYSPVISWSTVRLCFILAEKKNLITHQCDYANAYCQSPINEDLFMEIPPRFEVDDTLKHIKRKTKAHLRKFKVPCRMVIANRKFSRGYANFQLQMFNNLSW